METNMTDYPDYSTVCPACDEDVEVTVLEFWPEEPVSKDYPGCPASVEFMFKCKCGFHSDNMNWHEVRIMQEKLTEHISIYLADEQYRAADAKLDEYRDSFLEES
jgi:hypothetical protein